MPRIIGGVYLGGGAREAVVVDDRRSDNSGDVFLREVYDEGLLPRLKQASEASQRSPKTHALHLVFDTVRSEMPYDKKRVDELVARLSKGAPDTKIHLAVFAKSHAGVCRHQALLAAYLLEKLSEETDPHLKLNGQISVERNAMAMKNANSSKAHAWVRYTTSKGVPYIIDTAQGRIGKLQDLMKDEKAWEYARPDERARYERGENVTIVG